MRIKKQATTFDMDARMNICGKLEELIRKVEELRSNLIKIKEGRSYTDPEVIAASQELDAVLDEYQEMMTKNNDDKE